MNDIFTVPTISHKVLIRFGNCGILPCHHVHEHSKQQFAFLFYVEPMHYQIQYVGLAKLVGNCEENVFA